MSTPASYSSHTSDGFTVTTNTETEDQIRDNFAASEAPKDGEPEPEEDEDEKVSKAAAELGKLGGKAAAEKRKTAPIPDKPEAKAKAKPAEDEEEDEGDKAKRAVSEEIEKAAPDQKKKLASDRVAEATRTAAEAKRELAKERAEREKLARELREAREGREQAPAAAPAGDDPEPQENQYEDYKDYVKESARWAARQEYRAEQARAATEAAHVQTGRAIDSALSAFGSRLEEAKKADPEFMEKTLPLMEHLRPSFTVPPEEIGPENVIADEIIKSEMGPALLKHFVDNRDDYQRLAALRTPRDIAREVARIEAKVEATLETGATAGTPPAPERKTSEAKPPVRPVTGSPSTASADGSDDESFEAHVRRENAREKRARGAAR